MTAAGTADADREVKKKYLNEEVCMYMKKVLIGVCLLAALFILQGALPDWLEEPAAMPAVEAPQPQSAYVYVSGAVRKPGLYAFDETVRVGEAVHAAGGVLPYADGAAVNFADEAADGMHIHIPYDLNGAPSVGEADDGRININEADEEKLGELPGIGPAMVRKIIAYRDEHGLFSSIEELQKVKGIGPAKYKELQDKVTI